MPLWCNLYRCDYGQGAQEMKSWLRGLFSSQPTSNSVSHGMAAETGPGSRERREAERLLQRASLGYRELMVNSSQLGASWLGTFRKIEESEVQLTLELNDVQTLFDPGDFCTVTFNYDEHAHVFLTTVKSAELGAQGQVDVVLYMPDAIHTAGRRNLYRVPILKDLPMEVRIESVAGFSCPATAQDINTSGVRLKLQAQDFTRFIIGEDVHLAMKLDDISVHREADIRHLDGRSCALGLHFLNTEDLDERQKTGLLVREAERSYLRRVNRLE